MQDRHLVIVERYITPARFQTYLHHTAGDRHAALELYRWNMAAAGALYEALAVTEVCLRNAIDTQLRAWNANQPDRVHRVTGARTVYSTDWVETPAAPLYGILNRKARNGIVYSDYDDAHRRALNDRNSRPAAHRRHGSIVEHDDVVAHLTFGTWKKMLPKLHPVTKQLGHSSQVRLWNEALIHAFPHTFPRARPHQHPAPAVVHYWVDRLHGLRNRIAHLEPLTDTDIHSYHRTIAHLLYAIDPALNNWYGSISRVPELARNRPGA